MAKLGPISRKSLSDAVFERLRDHILDGAVEPGERLPAERLLADQLGVNRQAVREGLKKLEQAGLVDIQQGGGTRVLDFERTAGLEILASMIVTPRGLNTGMARHVLEMRSSMAPTIAKLCARRGRDRAERLHALVGSMRAADGDLGVLSEQALEFWRIVVRGGRNLAYKLAFNSLEATYGLVQEHMARLIEAELTALDDYEALADAIAAGDEQRAAALARAIVARGHRAVDDILTAIDDAEPR